jgi:hypothetical protein
MIKVENLEQKSIRQPKKSLWYSLFRAPRTIEDCAYLLKQRAKKDRSEDVFANIYYAPLHDFGSSESYLLRLEFYYNSKDKNGETELHKLHQEKVLSYWVSMNGEWLIRPEIDLEPLAKLPQNPYLIHDERLCKEREVIMNRIRFRHKNAKMKLEELGVECYTDFY